MRKYYEAYEERYRTIHEMGLSWAGETPTPIVAEVLKKYGLTKENKLLEIGCGEGRDAFALLKAGYDLTATDIAPAAIEYCQKAMHQYAEKFSVLDCIGGSHVGSYDFIYAVAVVHMLVDDSDRAAFYRFIAAHLNEGGIGLILSMGDGTVQVKTDAAVAFEPVERQHESGPITVAATTCRMVDFETFEREITKNGLVIVEKGLTEALPNFDCMMYAVVKGGNEI